MLGGLARRVSFVEKARGEGKALLVVDSGDLFFQAEAKADLERALAKARLLGSAYRRMQAAAVNVGRLDLILGLDFLRQEAAQGLPLVSANLLDANAAPVFSPYVIREIGGLRAAVFGLFAPEGAMELPDKIQVGDPLKAAKEVLEKLQGRADLVLLLSGLNPAAEEALSRSLSGVDFILAGAEGRRFPPGAPENRVPILQTPQKGMYLGRLKLTCRRPGAPFRDGARQEQMKREMRNLDLHLVALQRQQKQQPGPDLEQRIQWVQQQKARFEEQWKRISASSVSENIFSWNLAALSEEIPEDEEVRQSIRKAGFTKD